MSRSFSLRKGEYYVIRVHDNEAECLDTTNNGDGTLTFSTDRFSTYAIAFMAEYTPVTLRILNVGNGEPLAGAEFVLSDSDGEALYEAESDADGLIEFCDLEPGVYYLTETVLPVGYSLMISPAKLEIVYENGEFSFLVNDQPTGDILEEDGQVVIELTVNHSTGFSLPLTGGMGILGILFIGLCGIIVISVVTLRKKR